MNVIKRKPILLVVLLLSVTVSGCLLKLPAEPSWPDEPNGPTAEVTLSSGVWKTTIENEVIYQGSRLGKAITAAIENLGPGIINIRNSGELNDRISLQADQTLDFHNNTIGGNQSIHVVHQDNVTIRNLHMNGNPLHSLAFHGSSYIHLHNIWLQFSGNSGGIRIDNDRYENEVYTKDVKVT